ncbi:MAG: hypothetical protein Kow0010_17140 [Dehalococcoidia bacterium]
MSYYGVLSVGGGWWRAQGSRRNIVPNLRPGGAPVVRYKRDQLCIGTRLVNATAMPDDADQSKHPGPILADTERVEILTSRQHASRKQGLLPERPVWTNTSCWRGVHTGSTTGPTGVRVFVISTRRYTRARQQILLHRKNYSAV